MVDQKSGDSADSAQDDANKTMASSEERRRAVRNILAGTGFVTGAQALSGSWTRPVIESVVLPAHAQTTNIALGGLIGSGIVANGGSDASILDHLVRPAHAAPLVGGCIGIEIAGSSASVLLVLTNEQFGTDSFTATSQNFATSVNAGGTEYTLIGQFDQFPNPSQATGTVTGGGEIGSFMITAGAAGSCVKPSTGTTGSPSTTSTCPPPYYYIDGYGCYFPPG